MDNGAGTKRKRSNDSSEKGAPSPLQGGAGTPSIKKFFKQVNVKVTSSSPGPVPPVQLPAMHAHQGASQVEPPAQLTPPDAPAQGEPRSPAGINPMFSSSIRHKLLPNCHELSGILVLLPVL
eukprot:1149214-Pelagomonas_calceolata.AAC.1